MINLKQYLPEGIYLASNQDDKIAVEFDLIKYQKQSVTVGKEDVTINGYDEKKLDGVITSIPEQVEFYYDAAKHKKTDFSAKSLKLFVETNHTKKGTYDATLQTKLEGVVLNDTYHVQYRLIAR